MIQYYHNVAFCILSVEEHGIELDLDFINKAINRLEPSILAMPKIDESYPQNDMTSRWNKWNIFLMKVPEFHKIFQIFHKGAKEYIKHRSLTGNFYMNAWANLTNKDQEIPEHVHTSLINGHIAINAEPSTTTYEWLDKEKGHVSIDIENKNSQLVLTSTYLQHYTSVWNSKDARTTIAADITTPNEWPDDIEGPPMIPIVIND